MGQTTISWTEFSINPLRARNRETGAVGHYCRKISPGCEFCYAARWQFRLGTKLDFAQGSRKHIAGLLTHAPRFMQPSAHGSAGKRRVGRVPWPVSVAAPVQALRTL